MNSRFAIGAILTLLLLVGCGPGSNMGYVTGVVTLDGEPVGNASVSFYPPEGRPSVGLTEIDGSYELIYTREKMGALIGQHKVTVFQEEPIDDGAFGGLNSEPAPEFKKVKIPRKYTNQNTTDLTATVENGSNELNFELSSK